jgi:hypothetical protein
MFRTKTVYTFLIFSVKGICFVIVTVSYCQFNEKLNSHLYLKEESYLKFAEI